ncbi:arsenic resistance N-acetyltransferase ArsN2 [Pseudomonas sp. sp1636]|uniref:arsenic resistance N-acetyltransferase ArsN2 n=1 Tax=Pseudomonas sp. sp1636 TaxID=3036707 RepID=UPI0025A5FEF4|nr:arsenic resistance N-acetyltransferase ArsN2 [Pseudomonas sp. sp1636]MDM8350787.1 arsenic resistance N-acetyltransferase ArsN2 [Pseudomonas sp. sp1636]
MQATIQAIAIDGQAQQLLAACHLPTDDLQDVANDLRLFGCQAGGRLMGLVGLQIHGTDALLRSLAVADAARGQGLGAELLAHAERQAAAHGVHAIYLLTTTAEAFFARRGYCLSERATAPLAIAASRQFCGLCPATAAFMRKRL